MRFRMLIMALVTTAVLSGCVVVGPRGTCNKTIGKLALVCIDRVGA